MRRSLGIVSMVWTLAAWSTPGFAQQVAPAQGTRDPVQWDDSAPPPNPDTRAPAPPMRDPVQWDDTFAPLPHHDAQPMPPAAQAPGAPAPEDDAPELPMGVPPEAPAVPQTPTNAPAQEQAPSRDHSETQWAPVPQTSTQPRTATPAPARPSWQPRPLHESAPPASNASSNQNASLPAPSANGAPSPDASSPDDSVADEFGSDESESSPDTAVPAQSRPGWQPRPLRESAPPSGQPHRRPARKHLRLGLSLTGQWLGDTVVFSGDVNLEISRLELAASFLPVVFRDADRTLVHDGQLFEAYAGYAVAGWRRGRIRLELGGATLSSWSATELGPLVGSSAVIGLGDSPFGVEARVHYVPVPYWAVEWSAGLGVALGHFRLLAGWRQLIFNDRGVTSGLDLRQLQSGPIVTVGFTL